MRMQISRTLFVLLTACCFPIVAAGGPYDQIGPTSKIAHFHLSGTLLETPQDDSFPLAMGKMTSLKSLLERLAEARDDDAVKALALTYDGMSMGFAQLQEVRQALLKFKAVDKRVFVHADSLSTGTYALLSAASDLSVVPTSDVWLIGLYAEQPYAKGLLDKIGVQPDILQLEDYKSAAELFNRTGPSEAAEANMNWLLDGIHEDLIKMIAESRGLSTERVRALIDDGPYTAERALEVGLIDKVQYREDFVAELKGIYGDDVAFDSDYGEEKGPKIDFNNPFFFLSIFKEMFGKPTKAKKDSVAVVYVEGMILPGYSQPSLFGGSSGAYSGDISRALDKAAEDDTVKAVVLRVDSPGGSALASEIIWNATQRVRAKKPLIVSMGNVAGSGGYYVACGADAIFADATTITASIGVVGGKLVTTDMWGKLGITFYDYKRGENSDLLNTARPFNEQQRKRVYGWMKEIYEVFKGHVVAGRGSKLTKPIDKLAGGRVFTGRQAHEYGLVDKLGGFEDAVAYAAKKASIGDYDIRIIPEPKNFLDILFEELSGEGEDSSDLSVKSSVNLFGSDASLFQPILPILQRLDPMRAQAVMRVLQRLELIHSEHVILVMPQEIIIR